MCWTPPWGSAALWAVAGAAIVELRASVSAPVQAAAEQLRYAQRESPQQLADEPTDGFGVQTAVTKLCAQRVGSALFKAGMREGIVVHEPCGGIASGLDSVLANGFKVKRHCTVITTWQLVQ